MRQLDSGLWVPPTLDMKSDRTKVGGDFASNRVLMSMGSQTENRFRDLTDYLQAIIQVPWVFACVSLLAYTFASTPWRLMKGKKVVDDPHNPFLQLMAMPNPFMTGFQFKELLSMYMELCGESFIALEEVDGSGQPRELYLPSPARMRVIPDPQNMIKGYVYDASGQGYNISNAWLVPYMPEEILHLKYSNPLNEYRGLGNVEAGQKVMSIVSNMAASEDSYWASSGRITGVLQTENSIDDQAFERLVARWREFASDKKQRYRTAILEQGLKYEPVAEGLKGLDMAAMSKEKRDEILAIFGVPPNKLGLIDNASYKADEADRFFQSETCLPKNIRFEDGIQPLIDRFDPDATWLFNRVNYEDDVQKLSNALTMRSLKSFTTNEIRIYLGQEEVEGGDVIYLSTADVPVELEKALDADKVGPAGGGGTPAGGPAPGTPPGGGAGSPPGPAGPQGPRGNGSAAPGPGGTRNLPSNVTPDMVGMMTPKEQDQLRIDYERKVAAARIVQRNLDVRNSTYRVKGLARLEGRNGGRMPTTTKDEVAPEVKAVVLADAVRRAADKARGELVRKYLPYLVAAFRKQRRLLTPVINRMLKLRDAGERRDYLKANWPANVLAPVIVAVHREALNDGWVQGKRVLGFPSKVAPVVAGKADDWNPESDLEDPALADLPEGLTLEPVANPYLAAQWQKQQTRTDNRITGIDQTTMDSVLDEVEVGVTRGYSPLQIANGYLDENYSGVAGVFDGITDWRAETIARTESMLAYNAGATNAYLDSGVTQVEAADGEDDPECAARLDGNPYDLDPEQGPVDDDGTPIVDHVNGTLAWLPLIDDNTDLVDTGALDTLAASAWNVKSRPKFAPEQPRNDRGHWAAGGAPDADGTLLFEGDRISHVEQGHSGIVLNAYPKGIPPVRQYDTVRAHFPSTGRNHHLFSSALRRLRKAGPGDEDQVRAADQLDTDWEVKYAPELKGEGPGHPFRGNQYSSSGGGEARGLPATSILRRVLAKGGATFDTQSMSAPIHGYVVASKYTDRARPLDVGQLPTPALLKVYWQKNADLLSQPGLLLGVWADKETNRTFFDVVQLTQDLEEAKRLGRERDQIAVHSLHEGIDIPTGGSGGVKIARDERYNPLPARPRADGRGGLGLVGPSRRVHGLAETRARGAARESVASSRAWASFEAKGGTLANLLAYCRGIGEGEDLVKALGRHPAIDDPEGLCAWIVTQPDLKGGPGSGDFSHEGRPGEVGGSGGGGGTAISDAVTAALKDWQGSGYQSINEAARAGQDKVVGPAYMGPGFVAAEIQAIDSAMKPLARDTTLYRSMSVAGVGVLRGGQLPAGLSSDAIHAELATLKGTVFREGGFTATTPSSDQAGHGGVITEIHVPAGVKAIDMNAVGISGEPEQVLQRGLSFQVDGVTPVATSGGPVYTLKLSVVR